MTELRTVRFRILRDNSDPPSPDGSPVRFGLEDTKRNIQPPVKRADGMLMFEFELNVKEGPDPAKPIFSGAFANGPPGERFVYLAWPRLNGQGYVNRVKVRLIDIDWDLVREAQASDRPLEYDASTRGAGGGRVVVEWKLAKD